MSHMTLIAAIITQKKRNRYTNSKYASNDR